MTVRVMTKMTPSPAELAQLPTVQAYASRGCSCHQLQSCWSETCPAALPHLQTGLRQNLDPLLWWAQGLLISIILAGSDAVHAQAAHLHAELLRLILHCCPL